MAELRGILREVIDMATLSIRNLPDEDHRALCLRAARHGVSMEAEARAILHRALQDAIAANTGRRVPPPFQPI